MFNKQLKEDYINQTNNEVVISNNYLRCQFEKSSVIEEELKKDISNFTVYDIMEFYKFINSSSIEVIQVLNSHLKHYTQWCLQRNIVSDNQNHFLEMTKDMMMSCVNKAKFDRSVLSKEVIYGWIDDIPNPRDKFILLFLFEVGKSKNFKDIVNVKLSDINGNILKLSDGREIEISDKLKNLAQESCDEKIYYSISGRGVKTMPLVSDGETIVKNYPNVSPVTNEFQRGRIIYNIISRIFKYFDVSDRYNINNIVESGRINMIKSRAEHYNMSPIEYLYSDKIKEVEYHYGYKITRSLYISKYEEYLK